MVTKFGGPFNPFVYMVIHSNKPGLSEGFRLNNESYHTFIVRMHYPEKDENIVSTLNAKYALSLLTEKINV